MDMLRKSALFVYAFASGLLVMLAVKLYALWTGDWGSGIFILGALLAAFGVSFAVRKVPLTWLPGGVAILAALTVWMSFVDTASVAHTWEILSMKVGLTWEMWRNFVTIAGLLWLCPLVFSQGLIWRREIGTRGKLIFFVGVCTGILLGRILVGRVNTDWLLNIFGTLLLMSAPLIGCALATRTSARWVYGGAAALLVSLWWTFRVPAATDVLQQYPFGAIATRDLNLATHQRVYDKGRIVHCEGINTAPTVASQTIPLLLKPYDNARIAYRLLQGQPLYPQYDVTLQGQYDAIYVEVPPAWMGEERDYFGSAAMATLLEHLAPEGVAVYQVDARCLDARMVMARLAILKERFGYVQLWMTERNLWQMVASRKALSVDVASVASLLDRADVSAALFKANIDTPLQLLSSYLTDDFEAMQKALTEPVRAALPLRESKAARKLLFTTEGGGRLIAPFEPFRDYQVRWLAAPEGLTALKDVVVAYQDARHNALSGKLVEAAAVNPCDPFLLALAERDIATAEALHTMGKQNEALTLLYNAFAIAKPRLQDVLKAASLAQKSNQPTVAKDFYLLAEKLAPNDLTTLFQYMNFLAETKQYQASLALAERLVIQSGEETGLAISALAHSAKMMAKLGQQREAMALAYELAAAAETSGDKANLIPFYGDVLIECGKMKEAFDVKTHFEQTGELLKQETK